jgi:RsiW-degrading membrane proteinase PrsW (M82 family)
MASVVCCVDHVQAGTKTIGGRWFCDEHYQKATYSRVGFWRTGLFAVIALVVFVAAVWALDTFLKPNLGGAALVVIGVVLALVPAALWLIFFYQQDRLEPEPLGNVARLFVIGLALAGAVGIPLTDQFFGVQEWLYRDSAAGGLGMSTIFGSVFVIGAVEAFLIYAAVRYFIFDSPEFDERTDGVIYATAAGLGYATALNLQFILGNGGAALGAGEFYVAEVALAHAAFGGLLGYFLGRAKLEQEPIWWMPAGLTLTALLNGGFLLLRGQLDQGTVSAAVKAATIALPDVTGIALSGGLAIIVTAVVSWLINRDVARSLSDKQPPATGDPAIGDRQAAFATIGMFAVLLLLGLVGWSNAVNRTATFSQGSVSGAYPYYFSNATQDGDVYRVEDVGLNTQFIVQQFAVEDGQANTAARVLVADRTSTYSLYKVLDDGNVTVNGQPAFTQQFTYVEDNGLTGAVPTVRQGRDYVFIKNGQAVVVTLLTTPEDLAAAEPLFKVFLESIKF